MYLRTLGSHDYSNTIMSIFPMTLCFENMLDIWRPFSCPRYEGHVCAEAFLIMHIVPAVFQVWLGPCMPASPKDQAWYLKCLPDCFLLASVHLSVSPESARTLLQRLPQYRSASSRPVETSAWGHQTIACDSQRRQMSCCHEEHTCTSLRLDSLRGLHK